MMDSNRYSSRFGEKGKHKVGILSLGCSRNLVDSESILGRLSLKGYTLTDMEKADVGIVNTCAFIEDAKTESVDAILDLIQLKRRGKLKKIIVYGCLTQRYKDILREELPEVDAFVGKVSLNHDPQAFSLTPPHYAYIKICEGCINNCSYCIIPKIKGRFASLDMASILEKAAALEKQGISELNIIGQDITAYGIDLYGASHLPALLRKIIRKIRNIGWLRLLYLYPSRINEELLEVIRDTPQICKYIDLPLQHINSRILRSMYRDTTKASILRLIDKIRKRIPEAAIRTSVIVGFPSETDREFNELVRFIEAVKFERLGAFIYSREEGTAAYNFEGQVPKKIKIERLNRVMSCQQIVSRDNNKRLLGKVIEVLIDEGGGSGGVYLGRSQYDAPEVDGLVYVNTGTEVAAGTAKSSGSLGSGQRPAPGDFVKVKITDTLEYDLVGEMVR